MVHSHTASLGATEFGENDADSNIADERGIEVGVCGEGGAQDGREEFFGVGVFEVPFVGAGYGCTEGGENYDVRGVFSEDFF